MGKTVRFLYKGSFPDGTVFDDGTAEPHEITLGRRQVMEAIESALSTMKVGEEAVIELSAEAAYGPYDEDAVQRFPAYMVPNGNNLPVGKTIGWTSPRNSQPIPAKVSSIENGIVTLDFNHPLAGKDIVYWVKLVEACQEP